MQYYESRPNKALPREKRTLRYWEIIADRLSAGGWSWGCASAIDSNRQTIFVADAHRDDGKRYVVRADEILTAFLELESAIHGTLSRRMNNLRMNYLKMVLD